MFLKRLTLSGFKSFADTTHFDFGSGVTAVVGPNGCGKSNIVDAIKWVLGEQSAKSLRGRQMLDVLFNGSGTRKSSGLCQVELALDNTSRVLATDLTDVAVSRRLYRSGESEYLINGEPVRLKDVRELFMDTGIGGAGYSMIEQGRVDVLLQANPIERRTIFEDAAGISRFKARKKEAQRKLERATQNLLRVEDIIEEVERRLRSTRQQAGKARNYQAYVARLRELRASYSLAEFHRLTQLLESLRQNERETSDRAIGLRTGIETAEARAGQLDADIAFADEKIAAAEHRLNGVRAEISGNEERLDQTQRRCVEQEEVLARAEHRAASRVAQARELAQRAAEEERRLDEIAAEQDTRRAGLDELVRDDQQKIQQITAADRDAEEVQAQVIELVRAAAHVNNERATIEQHRHDLLERADGVAARRAAIAEQIALLMAQADERALRIAELDGRIAATGADLDEVRRCSDRLDADRSALATRIADARQERSGMISRRDTLLDIDRKMEGVGAGVREILSRRNVDDPAAPFGYVRGLVGELFEADLEHAPLVEAALGELDQSLVVESAAALLADADRIAALEGRVSAVCLDALPPHFSRPDLSGQDGFVARLADQVRHAPGLERLARYLFGDTLVVESLAAAQALRRLSPGGYRFVTRRGEVLEPDGRVALGPAHSRAGLVSRKSELRQLAEQIAELDVRIAALDEQLSLASTEFASLAARQQALRDALAQVQHRRIQADAERTNLHESVRRLEQEEALLAGEAESIRALLDDLARREQVCDEKSADLDRRTVEANRVLEERQRDGGRLREEREAIAVKLTELRVLVGQLGEQRRSIADGLNGLREALARAEAESRDTQNEVEACRRRIADGREAIAATQARLAELAAAEEQLGSEALALRRGRQEMHLEREEISGRVKQLRHDLEGAESELHGVQMRAQESNVRREELVARVHEELDSDLAALYESYEHAERDWSAVEEEIRELKQKIDRLGNVNLDAITELEELEKRHEFLASQRTDLLDAQKQLSGLIERLDAESRDRFIETFEATREHFGQMFRKLFGGGKANIVLENPEDVLESGIEIVAQPPGKELLRISLMSGGEKTMTAISLLLALFKSKPSPFAIMDEVDAALDEANNERFNRIITEFLDDSQFIIITHSKRTMTIADRMYGITMQEAGVSKRVAVKFEDDSGEGHTAVA